jgi:hypothetical protein
MGVTDEGRVYVEIGSTKVCLDEAQGETLLAVLQRFAEDVNFVSSAPGGRPPQADEHDPIARLVRMLPH